MTTTQPLLQSYRMQGLDLANRVVMAPLTRSRADNPQFVPSEFHAEYYAQRASAGLIIARLPRLSGPRPRRPFPVPRTVRPPHAHVLDEQ